MEGASNALGQIMTALSVILCRYAGETDLRSYSDLAQVDYPRVQFLDVRGLKLSELPPELPELIHLNGRDNCLTTVPRYPQLQWLDVSDNQLQSLPDLPRLQTLYCTNNPEFRVLPYLPALTYLEAMFTEIGTLRGYPSLVHANLAYTELGVITNCPALAHLNASMTNLRQLPNCPNLNQLHLRSSPVLSRWDYSDVDYLEFAQHPTVAAYHRLRRIEHPVIATNWPAHCVGAYALD